MEDQSSQASEALFDPVTKISQAVNEKDQKLIENEARIIYTKLEINKLQTSTKELNEKSRKLKAETELFQKSIADLEISIDINRKSLEVKSNMQINFKQELSKLEIEIKEQTNHCERVYNEYLEKYKEARNEYEMYHPLFSLLKQLQSENLKLEVQFKILQAKTFEKKKQIKLRREIYRQIFNTTIVKFAGNTLNYWKTRNLACQLEQAAKEEIILVQQLYNVEVLAVKMDKELRQKRTPVSNEALKMKNTEFMADQNWNELNSNNNNHNFATPAPISTSTYPSSFNRLDNPSQTEEMLLQIRARCEQRQQQWEKQRSFSSPPSNKTQILRSANRNPNIQMPVLGQTPLHGQKRSQQPTNLPSQSSQFKIPKTTAIYNVVGNENFPFVNQQSIQKMTPIPTAGQHSKAKIISVHNIRGNESSIPMNQRSFQKPLTPRDINNNLNQVMPQQTSHYLSQPSQNYPSTNIISQMQSQETNKNILTPSSTNISVGTPRRQSQGYHPENFFSEEVNKNTPVPSEAISKSCSQGPSHYSAQTPLQYHSENVVPESQLSITQKTTQEISQSKADFVDPYAMTQLQSGATQNLIHTPLTGNQAIQTPASNDTVATSQSSTFSQKYMELQHYLGMEFQEMVYTPPSAPLQIRPNKAAEPVLTSPFFNKPKPGETVEPAILPHENTVPQELISRNGNILTSPLNISQCSGTSGIFDNQEVDNNVSFGDDYAQVLSPEYDENNTAAGEPQTQSAGFSFNFAHPQTKQSVEPKFTFSVNPAANSNPFSNMF